MRSTRRSPLSRDYPSLLNLSANGQSARHSLGNGLVKRLVAERAEEGDEILVVFIVRRRLDGCWTRGTDRLAAHVRASDQATEDDPWTDGSGDASLHWSSHVKRAGLEMR